MVEAVALAAGAYVVTNIGPKFASSALSVRAAQKHAHKMDDIRFRIERQKLYRQDIRDLMQTGRRSMDTYQKVGTLLVSFTLALFTGSQAYASMFNPNSKVPEWIVAVFSINNLCAIGYLTLAIWLAMHAAVISDSVGARLLTSFARLSIPGREELEQIRTSINPLPLPSVRKMWKKGCRQMTKFRGKTRPEGEVEGDDDSPWRQETWPDLARLLEKQERRDTHHFHRFLKEQHKYLAYDEFSRVSMALGLNHLLATVSYYIIGVVWQRSIVAGAASLAATQLLMLLLLRLDVADDSSEQLLSKEFWPLNLIQDYSRRTFADSQRELLQVPLLTGASSRGQATSDREQLSASYGSNASERAVSAVSSPMVTTQILVCILVSLPPLLGKLVWEMDLVCAAGGLFCTLCFLMHAAWLFFIYKMIKIHKEDKLPNYLRTVRYLNVLDEDQRRLAKRERDQTLSRIVASLRNQRMQLQDAIKEVVALEERSHLAASTLRTGTELARLCELLQEEVNQAQLDNTAGFDGALSDELRVGALLLEHCSVWQAAPGVWASLLVLTSPLVRRHLDAEDVNEANRLHGAFARRCRELELGNVLVRPREATEAAARPRRTRSAMDTDGDAPTSLISGRQAVGAAQNIAGASQEFMDAGSYMELQDVPRPIIVVRADDTGSQVGDTQALWIDGETGLSSNSAPERSSDQERIANPLQIIESAAQWLSLANMLQQSMWAHMRESDQLHQTASGIVVEDAADDEQSSAPSASSVPRRARAPGWLPRVIVQRFSCGLMAIWVFAAMAHVIRLPATCTVAAPPEQNVRITRLSSRALHADWPEPARLFDVISIHCNDEAVLARGRFSIHVAQRSQDSLSSFGALDAGTARGFCDINGCGSLAVLAHNVSLQLEPGVALPRFGPAELTLSSWRLIAAAMLPCESAPCPLKVAAWDGTEIIMASARNGLSPDHWQVQPHFALRNPSGNGYIDVKALQFGTGGRSLLVLSGQGMLDGWDLVKGQLLGRWKLDRPAHAMCQSGSELLFVRHSLEGPILEASPWQPLRP